VLELLKSSIALVEGEMEQRSAQRTNECAA